MPILKEPEFVEKLPHAPGDSSEQREAETAMVAALSRQRRLDLRPRTIELGDGVRVQVDGVAADFSLLCEATARQGTLKSSQRHKVMHDAFTLTYLRNKWPHADLVLLFSHEGAAKDFRPASKSWMARAVAAANLEIEVVEIPTDLQARLVEAQDRQKR